MEVRDEVCGMRFTAATAAATAQLNGRTYYFCSERCKKLFEAHPGWFVPLQRSEDASSGE